MSKNAIIGFAPLMALCAMREKGGNALSRGMKWRRWWIRRRYVQQDKQFRNQRGGNISKGVLVAISIPIFTAQLEKSREATDEANLRSAYAEQTANLLTWDGTSTIADITVEAKQTQDDWQSGQPDIGGIKDVEAKTSGSSWTVSADTDNDAVTIS